MVFKFMGHLIPKPKGEQVYGGEIGEKEKQTGLCARLSGRSEEVSMVRTGMMLVACLPARTRIMSGAGLPPRAMSRYVILLQLDVNVDVNDHSDVQNLG